MKKTINISVFEVVGDSLCFASDDGQKVYERLASALKQESKVTLSFHNITTLTSAFLNTAIGQLYGDFSEEKILKLLRVTNIESDDIVLLKRVVGTAKQYFKDPDKFKYAIRKAKEEE